ncbi:conserved hypothetical protein [Thermotomaculum hydrothermale]|uniref:MBL fold metallo-hydrolase n=1 Tax=Thermotomaculum hydrothermale TaxID=981385 RepID=A0A7R6PZE2_9BACT|nr:MBL fold metallo-hydrolase [Thermotomaculum hydrothermale]BBB32533.1 conserved hypothetical protein [Thermotomaculum hydrothermale]
MREFLEKSVKWLGHDGFLIEFNGLNIYIDPFKLNDFSKKADIIFVTHSHYDHLSKEDIEKLAKDDTLIVCPENGAEQLDGYNVLKVNPGFAGEAKGISFKCVPAYNTNKKFHPKENNWVGYVIDFGGIKVYHAGDTDFIPEMKDIKTDIALLPVSGTYVMTDNEAFEAAKVIKPKIAVPMHYGSIVGDKSNADNFVSLCKSEGIETFVF